MSTILHVISGLKVGGAEMALHGLIVAARGGADRHVVASLSAEGGMRARFEQAGIELLVFDFRRRPLSSLVGLFKAMRRTRPDVVQTWMYHADLIGGLLARLAGCRKIIWGIRRTAVNTDARGRPGWLPALCAKLSFFIPSVIVCVAEAARRAHVHIGYDGARMQVVPNGFDMARLVAGAEQRQRVRSEHGIGAAAVAVGYLGRFHPDKDAANFVQAAGLAARQCERAHFLMVGRDINGANAQLMAWIEATGFADRFSLLGERSDVPACLAAMDLFCLSSRTEGFPNAVGEAMAMGLPCVVTDAGDAALLVGDTGSVVPIADPQALAGAMLALLGMSAPQRAALGQRARARIAQEYTIQRTCERFGLIYRQLTTKGSN